MESTLLDISIFLVIASVPVFVWVAYKKYEEFFDKKHPELTYDYDPKNWDRYNP